jgi:hypothetical protein
MVLSLCFTASGRTQEAAQQPAGTQPAAGAQWAAPAQAPQKVTVTFDNDVVILAFEVKADKAADYD